MHATINSVVDTSSSKIYIEEEGGDYLVLDTIVAGEVMRYDQMKQSQKDRYDRIRTNER